MARAFEAVDGEEVGAELDGGEGVLYCCAFVKDYAACFFEFCDDCAGGVAGGLDDFDVGIDDGVCIGTAQMWLLVRLGRRGRLLEGCVLKAWDW